MRQHPLRSHACFLAGFLVAAAAGAADYYVRPDGRDTGRGTRTQPFRTLARASSVLQPGDTCYLYGGIYRETLRPERSGTAAQPITYRAVAGETPVISGADVLSDWKPQGNGVYSALMDWTLGDGDQLFVNGEMMCEARWPNAGEHFLFQPVRASVEQNSGSTQLVHKALGETADAWKGADLWCAGGAAWICWTAKVDAYDPAAHALYFTRKYHGPKHFYKPTPGNLFVLRGLRRCLDAPGEWFYDKAAREMLFIPPPGKDIRQLTVTAKRRQDCIDLSGCSHIRITGLGFRAGGIRTNGKSAHNTLQQLHGRYVSHAWSRDVSGRHGVQIQGRGHLVDSCDLGYSSSSVVSVRGSDHRLINNLIHHGGYAGLWRGTVSLQGRRILFSHNTVRHAGRDLINVHGLMESLVQFNDISNAGWLTKDLGMIYGHNTDFANTRFCYNRVYDNRAKAHAMGIYFDHCSHNAIVDHNVIWNVGSDPVRFNNPSYGNLVFNNSAWRTGRVGTYDHIGRDDLFACRYTDNIFNAGVKLPGHVVRENNMIAANPPYRDPGNGDFRLTDAAATVGAYAPLAKAWRAGCDLRRRPFPLPVYRAPDIPWMNRIRNACFEYRTLEGWTPVGAEQATLTPGNGWGVPWQVGSRVPTGTSHRELRLGPGQDGVRQIITGLAPTTPHTLSAWLRVSEGETVELGVGGHGSVPVTVTSTATGWERKTLTFTTGPGRRRIAIWVTKISDGAGYAWADNLVLPAVPRRDGRTP